MAANEEFESTILEDGVQIWTGRQGVKTTPLSSLPDVKIASPTNGQALKYVAADGKWENVTESGGGFYTSLGSIASVGGETQLVVSGWSGTYRFYKVIFVNVPLGSHTGNSQFNLSFNGDTEQDGNGSYVQNIVEWNGVGTTFTNNDSTTLDTFILDENTGIYQEGLWEFDIWNLSGNQKQCFWKGSYVGAGSNAWRIEGTGAYTNSLVLTSVKIRTHRGTDTFNAGSYLEVIGYN